MILRILICLSLCLQAMIGVGQDENSQESRSFHAKQIQNSTLVVRLKSSSKQYEYFKNNGNQTKAEALKKEMMAKNQKIQNAIEKAYIFSDYAFISFMTEKEMVAAKANPTDSPYPELFSTLKDKPIYILDYGINYSPFEMKTYSEDMLQIKVLEGDKIKLIPHSMCNIGPSILQRLFQSDYCPALIKKLSQRLNAAVLSSL